MIKNLWINLPVKDVKKSKEFFTQLGFSFNNPPGNPSNLVSMKVGEKNFVVNLFDVKTFESFNSQPVADTGNAAEILLSFDAETKEEIDEMAEKVKKAGGKIVNEPADSMSWMYGFSFIDPDNHRWNMLYMDKTCLPGGSSDE